MKKVLSLIFSLFMSFAFFGYTQALGDKEQKFVDALIAAPLTDTELEAFSSDSEYWAEKASDEAKKQGFDKIQIYHLRFANGESRYVVVITNGGPLFVCDYYGSLYELPSSNPSVSPFFMPMDKYLNGYLRIQGKNLRMMSPRFGDNVKYHAE